MAGQRLSFIAVHGAFRGAWYWEPLARELAKRGHDLQAIDLPGMGHPQPPRRGDITMGEWIAAVVDAASEVSGPILLGHSMGGVVVQGALAEVAGATAEGIEAVLLDSPVVAPGQSSVDVSGHEPPAQMPPRDVWIEPTPLVAGGELSETLVDWVNERLCATPLGPQLDPLPAGMGKAAVGSHLVFFAETPAAYPAPISRMRCEAEGIPFTVAPGGHDQPVVDPAAVADLILGLVRPAT